MSQSASVHVADSSVADVAFDLNLDDPGDLDDFDTRPPETVPPDDEPPRALIAAGTLEERLYLRARLALAGHVVADDAGTMPQALELLRRHDYELAVVDLSLGGMTGWDFLREIARGPHPIPKVIVMATRRTLGDRWRARSAGVAAFLGKPPHPARLHALLSRD